MRPLKTWKPQLRTNSSWEQISLAPRSLLSLPGSRVGRRDRLLRLSFIIRIRRRKPVIVRDRLIAGSRLFRPTRSTRRISTRNRSTPTITTRRKEEKGTNKANHFPWAAANKETLDYAKSRWPTTPTGTTPSMRTGLSHILSINTGVVTKFNDLDGLPSPPKPPIVLDGIPFLPA